MYAMGKRVEASPIRVQWDAVRISLWALVLGWLFKTVVKLLIVIVRSPMAICVLSLTAITWLVHRAVRAGAGADGLGFLLLGIGLLRWRRPELFERFVYLVARSRWRRFALYRYRWPASMDTAGLNRIRGGVQYHPTAASRCGRRGRWIGCGCGCCPGRRSRTGPGRRTGCARPSAPRTAGSAPSPAGRTSWSCGSSPPTRWPSRSSRCRPRTRCDLDGLPVGAARTAAIYRLQLLGTHVLCAGATGAGKGSVLWSIIDQLAPAVRDGMVELWALDPKGGMELAAGAPLFARFVHGTRHATFADTPGGRRRGDAAPAADRCAG